MVSGNLPPAGISPLVPGGNCVVSAKTIGSCGDDNPSQPMEGGTNGYYNANQCQSTSSFTGYTAEEAATIKAYIRGDASKTTAMNSYASAKRLLTGKTALFNVKMSGGTTGDDYSASLDFQALATGKGSIIKYNLSRVSAFPDFIMDWVSRQMEEIVNKLTSLPTLFIVLPNLSGLQDSGWKDFGQKLKNAIQIRQNTSATATKNANATSSQSGL